MNEYRFSGNPSLPPHGPDSSALQSRPVSNFSRWHLLAAGLPNSARGFLTEANRQSLDQLIDDLREVMTSFPESLERVWLESPFRDPDDTWASFRYRTANRTPREICVELGRPILAGYGFERRELHPVIWAFHLWTCRSLGFDPQEISD